MLSLLLSLVLGTSLSAAPEEPGPDVIPVAASANPKPDTLPTIRVVREKLWGQYYPMVSMTFPNIPDFTCDAWCYESAVDFLDARPLDGGRVEMRHRDHQNPQTLVITTISPAAGAVILEARVELDLEARVELDKENHAGATLPAEPPGLNLCWQLRHAPAFASKPEPYPLFVKRCFIFTDRGRTFLSDTDRAKIPVRPLDHEYNSPPWVQMYVDARHPVPPTSPTAWAGCSQDRYVTPVIGAVSRDGKYLTAIANDSAESMCQAWHDCMHNNPKWLPENAPVADRRWRLTVYTMENDPKPLLERVAKDYPKTKP